MQDNPHVSDQEGNQGGGKREYRELIELAALGVMFPVAIATGWGIGRWLDHLSGWYPWLTIIFTVLGAAAAFSNLFRAGLSGDGGK